MIISKPMRLIPILLLLIAGCVTPPSQKELDAADPGPYPHNFEEIVKGYFTPQLKDPESARYRIITPFQGYHRSISSTKYGYITKVYINAKNGYGGYTGEKLWELLINNGNVVSAVPRM